MRERLAFLAIAVIAIGSCAGPGDPRSVAVTASTPAATGASATAVATPSGVIAIGHSGLTGEGTSGPLQALPANSWATGTSPEVNSVWLRLNTVRPDLAGEAVNQARGGAPSSALPDQAREALRIAPHPALVIISTIDNDIRCDGSDPDHVAEFGAVVDETLHLFTAAEPDVRILIVGQLGRPSIPYVEKLVAHDPRTAPSLTGTGMCDFLDPDGKPNEAHFKALTGIIDAYETEEARVCATVPQCRTDGGVRSAYVDVLENFGPDWAHLNAKGQAAEAELIWPVVADLLGVGK